MTKSLKQCYIDLETTGLSPNAAILQVACIIVIDGKVKRRFVINMTPHPGATIECNSNFHTRYNTKRIMNQSRGFKKFVNELEVHVDKYNRDDKFHFIAYNGAFDSPKVREWFLRNDSNFYGSYFFNPFLCLMQRAMWTLQTVRTSLKNYQLGTLCRYLGIDIDEDRLHDGEYDIDRTYQLGLKLDEYIKNEFSNGSKRV